MFSPLGMELKSGTEQGIGGGSPNHFFGIYDLASQLTSVEDWIKLGTFFLSICLIVNSDYRIVQRSNK